VQRGDIVVLHNPNNRSQANIKRVVALPGDTVEIKDGLLYVNDKKLERQLVGPSAAEGSETLSGEIYWETNGSAKYRVLSAPPTAPTAPTTALTATAPSAKSDDLARRTVPNGRCLVLGDNRSHSSDSRDYGPVPLADLIGRAECIYWPRWENLRK
jgi:signal peptidase I